MRIKVPQTPVKRLASRGSYSAVVKDSRTWDSEAVGGSARRGARRRTGSEYRRRRSGRRGWSRTVAYSSRACVCLQVGTCEASVGVLWRLKDSGSGGCWERLARREALAGGRAARREKVPQQALVRDITVCVYLYHYLFVYFAVDKSKRPKRGTPLAVSTLGGSHDIRVADLQRVRPTDRVTEASASTTLCLIRVTEA